MPGPRVFRSTVDLAVIKNDLPEESRAVDVDDAEVVFAIYAAAVVSRGSALSPSGESGKTR